MRPGCWAKNIEAIENLVLRYPEGTDYSASGFARVLGVSVSTIKTWKDKGLLRGKKDSDLIDPLSTLEAMKRFVEKGGAEEQDTVVGDLMTKQLPELEKTLAERGPPESVQVLGDPCDMSAKSYFDPKVIVTGHLHNSDQFNPVRDRAIKAAREAYRDEILAAADEAEKRGDQELQIRFLKEFIDAEEAFRVVFRKGDRHGR